ncbi:MAG: hypothetical protein IJ328_03755 [Muribaculaceae bacterium]|nr:hypothetical protein [Muribaculaceae bacterium]
MEKIKRYLTAIRRYHRSKGHGIHSPFAFGFTLNVLRERLPYYAYDDIAELRRLAVSRTKYLWRHPRIISFKNAKLIFRVTNYFNPAVILQIGTNYGISSASMLAVSSKSELYLCEPSISEYPVTHEILSHFGNKIHPYKTFDGGITAYKNACSKTNVPFVLINSVQEEEYSNVLNYLHGIRKSDGIIIIRNISRNSVMQALWEACRNAADTGMTFSNGKLAIIVASAKLPHQNFSLWF